MISSGNNTRSVEKGYITNEWRTGIRFSYRSINREGNVDSTRTLEQVIVLLHEINGDFYMWKGRSQ